MGFTDRILRRQVSKAFFCLVLIGATGTVRAADPISLPGGATPGGVLPQTQQMFTAPASEVFSIPPMIERPLGVDEGEKIVVNSFVLQGIMDRPETGIYRRDIETLAEKMRQDRPDGFTVGQLQEVANTITRYYRQKGLILAQAFVPEQEVKKGFVAIQLVEGTLGNVVVEGNKHYSAGLLNRPFSPLLNSPVDRKQIESALMMLTDYPGLTMFGVLRPGKDVGASDLVVKVQEERRVNLSFSLDNYGTVYTGELRGQANVTFNNPTGGADKLAFNVLQTGDPSNSTFGSFLYQHPVFSQKNILGITYNRNDFTVGSNVAALDISGDSSIAGVFYRHNMVRGRDQNLYAGISLDRKTANINQGGRSVGNDELFVLEGDIDGDSVDTRLGKPAINQGGIEYSHGFSGALGAMGSDNTTASRRGGSGQRASGLFNKFFLKYTRLKSITANQSLMLRLRYQYSDDLLVSLEQLSVGGPNSVRAFPTAEFLVDKGGLATIEWQINAPGFSNVPVFGDHTWGEVFQLSLFVDYGGGEINDPTRADIPTVDLTGAGLGLQLRLPQKFLVRADVATPIDGTTPSNGRDPQYFVTMNYQY